MKKLIIIAIVSILVFIFLIRFYMFTVFPMYSVVGSVEKAKLNSDGNIVIIDEEVNEQPSFISYRYNGVYIGLLAIRNSKGKVIVIVNTCQSCENKQKAYFLLKGNKLENQSCGNKIKVDDLDNIKDDGCYPIKIKDRKDVNGKIIIGTEQLKELKDRFTNWNGPKDES